MAKKISDATNRKKASLSEGFLDGEEEVTTTAEDVQPDEAASEDEGEPAPEGDGEEGDISDEGDPDGDGEEGDGEASDEEAGVEKDPEEQEQDLQDTMQTLITAVQALTDQISKQNGGDEEGGDEGGEGEGDDEFAGDDDAEFSDEGGEEGGEGEGEGEGEDDSDAEFEGDDEGEGEDDSDAEFEGGDETKSEAYNYFAKFGMPLNENSGYLMGKIINGRFDKLEPFVMAIVEQKIHDRIEGAKKEFRTEAYNAKYGKDPE